MMRLLLSLLFFFFSLSVGLTQNLKVEWLTWEQAMAKSKVEKKKIFVDIYTEWCTWCKRMDKSTFQKDIVAGYLNDEYYAVKFDAETKKVLTYLGKEYKHVKGGRNGYNELALTLTKGELQFPTIVFLDEELNIIQHIPGFRGPSEFEMIMTYFGSNAFKSTAWSTYTKIYQPLGRPNPTKNAANKLSRTVNHKN